MIALRLRRSTREAIHAGPLAGLGRRLRSAGSPPETLSVSRDRSFALVRRERLVVGPTTLPYPLNHETVLATSDSVAELHGLCDKIAGGTGGGEAAAPDSDNWIDAIPGEKIFSYTIRRA